MSFSFDASRPAGNRILTLEIINEYGSVKDTVVSGGNIQGNASRTFRLVTLNFLSNGGDDYPYGKLANADRRNLYSGKGYGEKVDYPDENLSKNPGQSRSFSRTGHEQDSLAEYMMNFHPTSAKAFAKAETPRSKDQRISY